MIGPHVMSARENVDEMETRGAAQKRSDQAVGKWLDDHAGCFLILSGPGEKDELPLLKNEYVELFGNV